MNISFGYLLIEDVLSLAIVFTLFYLKQRPYVIYAIILLLVIILTNVVSFIGPHSAFIGAFPLIFFIFTGISLKRFTPRVRITNIRILRTLLVALICIILLSIVALVIIVVTSHI